MIKRAVILTLAVAAFCVFCEGEAFAGRRAKVPKVRSLPASKSVTLDTKSMRTDTTSDGVWRLRGIDLDWSRPRSENTTQEDDNAESPPPPASNDLDKGMKELLDEMDRVRAEESPFLPASKGMEDKGMEELFDEIEMDRVKAEELPRDFPRMEFHRRQEGGLVPQVDGGITFNRRQSELPSSIVGNLACAVVCLLFACIFVGTYLRF